MDGLSLWRIKLSLLLHNMMLVIYISLLFLDIKSYFGLSTRRSLFVARIVMYLIVMYIFLKKVVCAASCIYIILFRPQIIKKGYNTNAYVLMTNSRFKLNELFLGWDHSFIDRSYMETNKCTYENLQISRVDRWKMSKFRSGLIWNAVNFVKLSRIWVKNFNYQIWTIS